MELEEGERKALDLISKKNLIKKSELAKLLDADNIGFMVVERLLEKKLITKISPLGEGMFALTSEGIKVLKSKS